MSDLPLPGQRIALRWRDQDGPRELIGYVRGMGPDGLAMLDRTLAPRLLAWDTLESWRGVPQVPRGRDPLAADRALLDRMATDHRLVDDRTPDHDPMDHRPANHGPAEDNPAEDSPADHRPAGVPRPEADADRTPGADAVCQVARLCDLLGRAVPEQGPEAYDTGGDTAACALGTASGRAVVVGEWATVRLTDGDRADEVVTALARWAAYRDARNVQLRGTDRVLAGFTVLPLRHT